MPAGVEDARRDRPSRPSWRAVADVIGHCVLVFAFVPPLAAVPRWLYFEAHNSLNLQDAIVLAFVPARGLLTLLDAFSAGVAERVLGGALTGVLLSELLARHGRRSTARERIGLGALGGALAASVAAVVLIALGLVDGGDGAGHVALGLVTGTLCGAIAAPGAQRLLHAWGDDDPAAVVSAP